MRSLLTWLMVFCVVAGLNARVLGASTVHVATCSHAEEVCCDHSHEPVCEDLKCDGHQHQDGEKCPQEHHHHHHGCCHNAQPLTVENDHFRQPAFFGSTLPGIRHACEIAPEEPFLGSEKPPLI